MKFSLRLSLMSFRIKKAFTLIELLVIVAIIGLLLAFILVSWARESQRRAAIVSYKSTMQSLRTAMEGCAIGIGFQTGTFVPGSSICGGSETFPAMSAKCNGVAPSFMVGGPAAAWQFTTSSDGSGWDCQGCRLICSGDNCTEAVPGSCK